MRVWEIIRIVEDSPVQAEAYDGISTVIYRTPDGHRFEVFMDCGEPDYLNWLDTPAGERTDFWPADRNHHTDAVEALGHLASNLVALPHVRNRLLTAAQQLPNYDTYSIVVTVQ